MRLGITIGETVNGDWEVLALPDKQVQDQRVAFKALKVTGGLLKSGNKSKQFKRIYFYDNFSKRAFFNDIPAAQPEIK